MMDLKLKHSDQARIFRDLIIILIVTILTFIFALVFDLSEQFYQWSRLWEKYQADELLFPLLSFSICLIWFSWRRYREAKAESITNETLLAENRLLIQNMTENQEHERLFLSQELHDVFAQYLTALRTHGEIAQTITPAENIPLVNTTQKMIDIVDKLHGVTRTLLKTLRPPLLEFGVILSIEDLVTEWRNTHQSIQCDLEFHGTEPDLNEEELLTLYRTVQEGLSNIARHTKAKHVEIDLYFLDNDVHSSPTLSLQIINDGTDHLDTRPIKSGLGLIGIRERATMLKGHFEIGSLPPDRAKLTLRFPVHKQDVA